MDNETTIPEPTLEESIATLLNKVPTPVRDFILNELPKKTEELMDRYALHIDQGGLLERDLLLMLLGQEQPSEFVAALQAAGIPAATVQSLAGDINTEIFMRLHASESATGTTASQLVTRQAPTTPATSTVTQPLYQAPVSIPSAPLPSYQRSAPDSVVAPRPMVSAPSASVSQFAAVPLYPTNPPAPVVTKPVSPTNTPPVPQVARTMAQDMAAFGGNTPASQAPHSGMDEAPAVVPQPHVQSAPSFTPTPVPATSSSPNKDALHAVLKEYGIDPYRELPD